MERKMNTRAQRLHALNRSTTVADLLTQLDHTGMTREQIAQELGVSSRSIQRWLHKETFPQQSHVARLAGLLGREGEQHE